LAPGGLGHLGARAQLLTLRVQLGAPAFQLCLGLRYAVARLGQALEGRAELAAQRVSLGCQLADARLGLCGLRRERGLRLLELLTQRASRVLRRVGTRGLL